MTRSFRYHLGWIAAALLFLLLAGLVPLWLWSRERAIARETSEKAAVAALELLAQLRDDYEGRVKAEWTGDIASLLAASMPSPSLPMPPDWDEIYQGDVRGKGRPTTYGYLFEALPARGFSIRAFPAKDDRLRTFVIDRSGQVIAK